MFNLKRYVLMKRIWRLRQKSCRTARADTDPVSSTLQPGLALRQKTSLFAVMALLTESSLESFLRAINAGLSGESLCVRCPQECKDVADVINLLCRIFRGKEYDDASFYAKPLPGCMYPAKCLNPFHYGKLIGEDHECKKDFPKQSRLICTDDSDYMDDLLTENPWLPEHQSWCSVTYWEERMHIGRVIKTASDRLNIFYDMTYALDGFCLAPLANEERKPVTKRILQQIGQGLVLWREGGRLWLYNRCSTVVFTSSTLLDPTQVFPHVTRVAPGCCLCLSAAPDGGDEGTTQSKLSPRGRGGGCIRISFMKGWGDGYVRRYVSCCPCWLEIYVSEARQRDCRLDSPFCPATTTTTSTVLML